MTIPFVFNLLALWRDVEGISINFKGISINIKARLFEEATHLLLVMLMLFELIDE